jgi:DNA-binding beta-propeller fold protein YncE
LEATISLGAVKGRIDHLAVDVTRQRLFVAELGNNAVAVIDLKERRLLTTLAGFSEPQGIGYVPSTNEIYVANGGDGTIRILGGDDYSPRAQLTLGIDADNIRIAIDPVRVLIGYGNGALAVVDPAARAVVADIRLTGHPEGLQIAPGTSRVLINVPDSREVAAVDLASGKQVSSWPLRDAHGNYPLAMAETAGEFWVATRTPARLILMNANTGARRYSIESCGDADDVYVDARRHRIYVSCGSGFIDVWEARDGRYLKTDQQTTRIGARTALFVPELDRLYLAVRDSMGTPAAIWIFRPSASLLPD